MMRYLLIFLMLAPAGARAEFALSDMVGTWSGDGVHYELVSKARMKCRLKIAGDDAKVTLSGRCGSSLGAEDVVLDFVRQGDGRIVARAGPGAPPSDSAIEALYGRTTQTQMNLRGEAGTESVVMQFVKNADGTLYFATQRDGTAGKRTSAITLTRR